jgi:hypothetical protein
MTKIRVNWTIEKTAYSQLLKVAKEKKKSMSWLVETLILDKLSDPIQRYKHEIAEHQNICIDLAKKIEQLKKLEEQT